MARGNKKKCARFANNSTVYLKKRYEGFPVGYALEVVNNEKMNKEGKKHTILVKDTFLPKTFRVETKYLYQ